MHAPPLTARVGKGRVGGTERRTVTLPLSSGEGGGDYRRLLLAAGGGLEGSPQLPGGTPKRQEIVIINKSLRDT